MGVGLEWDAEGPAEPQVGDLELELGPVDEEVLRLEVAVEDAVLVAVAHALDELPHEPLHNVHGHRRCVGTLKRTEERKRRGEVDWFDWIDSLGGQFLFSLDERRIELGEGE